ncbi:MAG: hypothetical protein RR310_07280 [Eubacterium sp.]
MRAHVKSTVKINARRMKELTQGHVIAMEQTAEALKTEVIAAEVMPFDVGTMQNESTFVDDSQSKQGKVSLVTSTPYARRMYYHPEYDFQTVNNVNAQGNWYEPWIKGKSKNFCKSTFKRLYKKVTGV